MDIQHCAYPLAGLTVHHITFDPASFTDADLLWLPHHARLLTAGRKRQTEHLAGRLAAFHALRAQGLRHIPDIGEHRQPLWPAGWYGSISHSANQALAVVARQRVGVDLEAIFAPRHCEELADCIITPAERQRLDASDLPFPLALSLAFSAKESVYKACSDSLRYPLNFHDIHLASLTDDQLTLARWMPGQTDRVYWRRTGQHILTLYQTE